MKDEYEFIDNLMQACNSAKREERFAAVAHASTIIRSTQGLIPIGCEVNNHVHTTYSFSPYEPAAAVCAARKASLAVVGSVDHESIGAAEELLDASKAFGLVGTVGFEVRASFEDSPFFDRKINNPDSRGIAYMCVHGIPRNKLSEAEAFLLPLRKARFERNRQQVERLNQLLSKADVDRIDFQSDIVSRSRWDEKGNITERHILAALVETLVQSCGDRNSLLTLLRDRFSVKVDPKQKPLILDSDNPFFLYDMLGLLKSQFLNRFFIQPSKEETPDVRAVADIARSIGAIAAYAYLGDVKTSVTGDKKPENFEDAFLDQLIAFIAETGIPAVTYMPPRNTISQIRRVRQLCQKHDLMQISGVDINSPRQSFGCPQLREKDSAHLTDSGWALAAHERLSDQDARWGLFHHDNPYRALPLAQRIVLYARWARQCNPFEIESICVLAQRSLKK